MGRRPGLPLGQRNMAIGMLTGGMMVKDVAQHFHVSESAISRLRTKYRQTGTIKDRTRPGRPRKTTRRGDNFIVTSSRRNRFLSSTRIAGLVRNATGTRICPKTVRNRLRAARLRGRRPYVGVPLTPANRRIRLNWTRAHHCWTRQQWNQVVFTDESRFNLKFADGRLRVWRRDGERMDPANVIQQDRFHGNLNDMRYCNEIVQPALLPFLRQGHATIFQQDNARCHVARHKMNFLQTNNVNVLDWPARSPDISPIEHLWDHLGRRVKERNDVNKVRDLERVLHE